MTDKEDKSEISSWELLEEALDQRGLTFGEIGTGEVGEIVYQRFLAHHSGDTTNEFDFELLSMFTILRLTNEIGEEYSEEYNRIMETPPPEGLNEIDLTLEELAEKWARIDVSDETVLFFTLAHEKIEQLSKYIVEKEIIGESYQGTTGTGELVKSLSQPQREQLLLRTETIDSGLHSKMSDTRDIRNSLMHKLDDRYFGETERNLLREIERAIEAINELYGMTEEYEILSGIIVEFR